MITLCYDPYYFYTQSVQDLSPHSLNIFLGRESELEYTAGNQIYGTHCLKAIIVYSPSTF